MPIILSLAILAILSILLLTNNHSRRGGGTGSMDSRASARIATGATMKCGDAKYCGVLTLETGYGVGNYKHSTPVVHGLWNEIGPYGNSTPMRDCSSGPTITKPIACYDDATFQEHEWTTHGINSDMACSSEDFFGQVCSLASAPLSIMTKVNNPSASGTVNLTNMSNALISRGYGIFDIDHSNSQIELYVCAGSDGQWKLSSPTNFAKDCS